MAAVGERANQRRSRGGLRRALSGGGGTSAERQRRGPTGGGGGFRPAAAWRGVSCAGVGCVGREAGPALTGGVRAAGRRPIGASHTRLREAGAGRCGYSAARVKRKAGARGDGQGPRPMSGRVLRPRGEGGRAAFPGSCLKGARPPARLVVVLIGQRGASGARGGGGVQRGEGRRGVSVRARREGSKQPSARGQLLSRERNAPLCVRGGRSPRRALPRPAGPGVTGIHAAPRRDAFLWLRRPKPQAEPKLCDRCLRGPPFK